MAESGRFKMAVRDYMDVANSEDEWDHEQDKLLLDDDGPVRKRRRYESEDASTEEEFLGLAGSEEESDEAGLDEEEMAEGEEEEDGEREAPSEDDGWDAADAYGADIIEDEEDAKEMEAEAIRLQKRHRATLTDADFDLDEDDWFRKAPDGSAEHTKTASEHVTEILPLSSISKDTPPEEKLRILRQRYPEFEPLSQEYTNLIPLRERLAPPAQKLMSKLAKRRESFKHAANAQAEEMEDEMPIAVMKYLSLSAYLGALALYFAVYMSNAEHDSGSEGTMLLDPKELRDHPIMDILIKQKRLWEEVKQLPDIDAEVTDDDEVMTQITEEDLDEKSVYYTPIEQSFAEKYSIQPKDRPRRKRLSKAEKAQLRAEKAAGEERKESLKKMHAELDSFADKLAENKKRKSTASKPSTVRSTTATAAPDEDDVSSDFGDDTELTLTAAQEKDRRKKSLRFYTSQITQKAAKRSAALDTGGDMDIPYRERFKDRQARLNAEAEARGKKASKRGGDDDTNNFDDDSDDEDRTTTTATATAAPVDPSNRQTAASIGSSELQGLDYYNAVVSAKAAKKAAKEARQAALREADRWGAQIREVEQVGADGRRAITYTMEKNRGLTQKRGKEVRNPRVKKRLRFEDKKKKLASTRPVYKGGEPRGGYAGELTGIKANLVRSTKLS